MNVNDVDKPVYPETCWLAGIFVRQHELMEKYFVIEKNNGMLQTDKCPVDIDDKFGQARLKDFAWRFTEELGEAFEAKLAGHEDHYQEELADALHFLTEFSLLAGVYHDDVAGMHGSGEPKSGGDCIVKLMKEGMGQTDLRVAAFKPIMHMGLACNFLKNKPWKISQMRTDVAKFKAQVREVWVAFMYLLVASEMSAELVYDLYFRKSEVNKFRQRSNY